MKKNEILKEIEKALSNPAEGRNSMGCSESYYNPFYMVGKCFTKEELGDMQEVGLQDIRLILNAVCS